MAGARGGRDRGAAHPRVGVRGEGQQGPAAGHHGARIEHAALEGPRQQRLEQPPLAAHDVRRVGSGALPHMLEVVHGARLVALGVP
jgi:hypothetical protein